MGTFPTTPGAFVPSDYGHYNFFVAKFNHNVSSLLFSTYIGGYGEDRIGSMCVDDNGTVYIAGRTNSENFPVTSNAMNAQLDGEMDGFLLALGSNGTNLHYSSYIGGKGGDYVHSLDIDFLGDLIITGTTGSPDFPVTEGAYDEVFNSSDGTATSEIFIMKLDTEDYSILFSTFLGGNKTETAWRICTNSTGYIFLTGVTSSPDFPSTAMLNPSHSLYQKLELCQNLN